MREGRKSGGNDAGDTGRGQRKDSPAGLLRSAEFTVSATWHHVSSWNLRAFAHNALSLCLGHFPTSPLTFNITFLKEDFPSLPIMANSRAFL